MNEDQRERLRRLRRERAEAAKYDTGYAKPPANSRFSSSYQPQRAGRRSKSRAERIADILDENVSLKINGISRKMSILDASIRQLAHSAMSGDMRAIRMLLTLNSGTETHRSKKYPDIDYSAEVRRKLEAMGERFDQEALARSEAESRSTLIEEGSKDSSTSEDDQ